MKRILLALLLLAGPAFAAGTITCTKTPGTVAVHVCSAVADATNATGTVSLMRGYIERVVTNPGDGGDAPTGVWTCGLTDANGVDTLGAVIAGVSTSASVQLYPMAQDTTTVVSPWVQSPLTMTCTGIGDANTATVTLYVRE
ncbi:MAG: hypothetical protein P1P84_02610 [Deferrisomatales bacterium]|nr:hypothetical protein [Deferrisomatales bacterium]